MSRRKPSLGRVKPSRHFELRRFEQAASCGSGGPSGRFAANGILQWIETAPARDTRDLLNPYRSNDSVVAFLFAAKKGRSRAGELDGQKRCSARNELAG